MSAPTEPFRIPLWPKEALRPPREVAAVPSKLPDHENPPTPAAPALPVAGTVPAPTFGKKKQASPLGAGRAVFGATVQRPGMQGAGKAIFEAPARRVAEATAAAAVSGRAIDGFLRPKTVGEVREQFLTTEAGQYLKLQKEHMRKSASAAERQRVARELARAESVMFIKRQELQRVEIRQRAVEASSRAAALHAARAKSERDTAAAAARDRADERTRLESELGAAEHDFDRRILAEKKGIESVGREISQLTNRGWGDAPEVGNLRSRRISHERGSSSIEHERTRRRSEATAKIARVGREAELQTSRLRRAERDLSVAESLLERYRLQAQTLKASQAAVEGDLERSRRDVEHLRTSLQRLAA